MVNPGGQVVMDEDVARHAEERYVQLEVDLHEMRQQNEGLTRELQL